jgi:hypothetical protein
LGELEQKYPDPPLVMFLSNNEAARLPWTAISEDPGYRSRSEGGDNAAAEQAAIGAAWSARYRALELGFRNALDKPRWPACAIFVGFNAFGAGYIGRWSGWREHSLLAQNNMTPESEGWDGASVPFYVNVGDPSTDYAVWGPQVAAMNWVPMQEQLREKRPNFWFEMSTWDGALEGDARSKPAEYRRRGQVVEPARYGGMVQFGMWLLRPRSVREYRGYLERTTDTEPYWAQIVAAVDRVYTNPTLKRFWREGTLVANTAHDHPYSAALPDWFTTTKRWFLLDTSIDPPRPWTLRTELKVFALALSMGQPGSRQWLIYAHAPLGGQESVAIDIPGYKSVAVSIKVGGTFVVVDERSQSVHEL